MPTLAPTVTKLYVGLYDIAFDAQFTVVEELHDAVPHTPAACPAASPIPAVAVSSAYPKLRPVTVTEAPPVHGPFPNAAVAIAPVDLVPVYVLHHSLARMCIHSKVSMLLPMGACATVVFMCISCELLNHISQLASVYPLWV